MKDYESIPLIERPLTEVIKWFFARPDMNMQEFLREHYLPFRALKKESK